MIAQIRRHVLVIAYYFPPMGLSGVQRVTKFVKYLPDYGWQPTVLSVIPRGYFAYDETLLEDVDAAGVRVVRTGSWDPTRFFKRGATVNLPAEATRRRMTALSQWLFVPDNKIGWLPHAVRHGSKILNEQPFDAIFSTAPPYTSHFVGAILSRRFHVPLLLDYRDDWLENPRHTYPTLLHRQINAWMERFTMRRCCLALTINDPIKDSLSHRNSRTQVEVLPQGYDPADFEMQPETKRQDRMRFVYSGIFYDAQKPEFFLRALSGFLKGQPEAGRAIEAIFAGLLPEGTLKLIEEFNLSDVVRYVGYVDHGKAVAYQMSADVLWMTIGRRPGAEGISTSKLFEYFGARKPILALVPEGAARYALRQYGATFVVEPDDVEGIQAAISQLFELWKSGRLPKPAEAYVQGFDRRRLTAQLADHLSACMAER